MIITDFLAVQPSQLQYWENIAANKNIHMFTILSVESSDNSKDHKIMTFSYNSNYVKFLMIDIFYAGRMAQYKETRNIITPQINNNEAAY